MPFNFKASLIKVQGGQSYLPVSARLIWFREEHPDWGIETEPIEINHEKQYAVFRARIYNADGRLMAMGTKKEDVKGFGDYIEKSETGSVGRALALCGYGTQFSPDLDETSGRAGARCADSPQVVSGPSHPAARPASDFKPPAPQQMGDKQSAPPFPKPTMDPGLVNAIAKFRDCGMCNQNVGYVTFGNGKEQGYNADGRAHPPLCGKEPTGFEDDPFAGDD